jgi:hypothetical protein
MVWWLLSRETLLTAKREETRATNTERVTFDTRNHICTKTICVKEFHFANNIKVNKSAPGFRGMRVKKDALNKPII